MIHFAQENPISEKRYTQCFSVHASRAYSNGNDPILNFRSSVYSGWIGEVQTANRHLQDKCANLATDWRTNGKEQVQERLLELNSFLLSSSEKNTIPEAIYTVLQRLVNLLSELDRNLSGTLVGVGSFFDGTRVGAAPNEFDYIYVLTEVSSSLKKAEPLGSLEWRLQSHSESAGTSARPWLSNIMVRDRLSALIDQAMRTIPLPAYLHHGGIMCPCFSGIRKNGPALTLLFAWSGGPYRVNPLLVSVDITIGIRPHHLQIFVDEEGRGTIGKTPGR